MKELQAIVRALCESTEPNAVLATLVSAEGSSYRRPGARLLLLPDGRRIGSISGGCLEEDVLARAARVAATGTPDLVVYDTTSENDLVWGVGLGCHGIVRVFIERLPVRPEWALALSTAWARRQPAQLAVAYEGPRIGTHAPTKNLEPTAGLFVEELPPPVRLCLFGAGDDAQPLARLGAELGWLVTVADPRPAFATAGRFPQAERVITGRAEDLVAKAAPDPGSLAVVMTHHYIYDVPLLKGLLPLPLSYLGLLGPRKRAERLLGDLEKAGFATTSDQQTRLHAPMGLDLGAEGPEQVALAIVAEIHAVLSGRDARPLRERTKPIHE